MIAITFTVYCVHVFYELTIRQYLEVWVVHGRYTCCFVSWSWGFY